MTTSERLRRMGVQLCLPALAGFLWVWFGQTLPNNPSLSRSDFWLLLLYGTDDVSSAAPVGLNPWIIERAGLVAAAMIYWVVCLIIGREITARLRSDRHQHQVEIFTVAAGVGVSVQTSWTLAVGAMGFLSTWMLCLPGAVGLLLRVLRKRSDVLGRAHQGRMATFRAMPRILRMCFIPFGGGAEDNARQSAGVDSANAIEETRRVRRLRLMTLAVVIPFAGWTLCGALTPSTDFDVREYHLQGPKEWFLAGRITFLEHNVYTSFPFLSEMVSLNGMVFCGDWWRGALAGKAALFGLNIWTAAGAWCIARRMGGGGAAWLALLFCATTPWMYRISLIAYAEGAAAFFLTLTTLWLLQFREGSRCAGSLVTGGVLAGAAMASKYPGAATVVIPAGLTIAVIVHFESPRQRRLLACWVTYTAGVLVAVGPWLIRNLVNTGNPVYPLVYSLFGGVDWNPALDERWRAAHSPTEHSLMEIPRHVLDVVLYNDWTSGLLFIPAAAALLLLPRSDRRHGWWPVLAMTAFSFTVWWALTHRIDRFWVPAVPLCACLAAMSWRLSTGPWWRRGLLVCVASATIWQVYFCTTSIAGFNAGRMGLEEARRLVIRDDLATLNQLMTADDRVLMVGEAEVFDCTFSLTYNTVFDACRLEQLLAESTNGNGEISDASRAIQALRGAGITYVYVNWAEILRYRRPGSYGYAEFVQPVVFDQLVEAGVLMPPRTLRSFSSEGLSAADRQQILSWKGGEGLSGAAGTYAATQLYRVRLEGALPVSRRGDG